jgi:hypothetical protein
MVKLCEIHTGTSAIRLAAGHSRPRWGGARLIVAEPASLPGCPARGLGLDACLRSDLGVVLPPPRRCREPVERLGDSFFHAREVILDVRQAPGQLPALPDLLLNPKGDLTWHSRIRLATHMRLNAHAPLTHAPGAGNDPDPQDVEAYGRRMATSLLYVRSFQSSRRSVQLALADRTMHRGPRREVDVSAA